MDLPPELARLEEQMDAIDQDAQALAAGLSAEHACWRARPDSWNVAECLDHLATTNLIYIDAMRPAAQRAAEQGLVRHGPALPGIVGGLFVKSLEPPVSPRLRFRAPQNIRPRSSPPIEETLTAFLASQQKVRAFLRANAGLDLARVPFRNPFLPGVRFSLATALHAIAAHDRRHLWQAWRIRRLAEAALGATGP